MGSQRSRSAGCDHRRLRPHPGGAGYAPLSGKMQLPFAALLNRNLTLWRWHLPPGCSADAPELLVSAAVLQDSVKPYLGGEQYPLDWPQLGWVGDILTLLNDEEQDTPENHGCRIWNRRAVIVSDWYLAAGCGPTSDRI